MDATYYATLNGVQQQHWWYAARRRILERVVRQAYRFGVPAGTLYDLGCGVGANLEVLEQFGPTIGIDTSPEAVAFCRERGHRNVQLGDLNGLQGVPDGSASVGVLADVIEHLDDERPCLVAARRALAPGGVLIVTVPAYMFLWGPADEINHHRRRYTAERLRTVIAPLFEVQHLTYFNTLLFGLVLMGRFAEKALRRPGDDMAHVPSTVVNGVLRETFAAEAAIVPRLRLPFGVSILCVARKR